MAQGTPSDDKAWEGEAKGVGIDYLLLVEALGRIQWNLKLEIGEDWKSATLTVMEIMSRQLLTLLHRNCAQRRASEEKTLRFDLGILYSKNE